MTPERRESTVFGDGEKLLGHSYRTTGNSANSPYVSFALTKAYAMFFTVAVEKPPTCIDGATIWVREPAPRA